MALRRIESITNTVTGASATVFRDTEWQEYLVKFYNGDGLHLEAADYHTDSLSDAQHTDRTVWRKDPTGLRTAPRALHDSRAS